jgi:hypothetical protein
MGRRNDLQLAPAVARTLEHELATLHSALRRLEGTGSPRL